MTFLEEKQKQFPTHKTEIDSIKNLSKLLFNEADGFENGMSIIFADFLAQKLQTGKFNNLHQLAKIIRAKREGFLLARYRGIRDTLSDEQRILKILRFMRSKGILTLDNSISISAKTGIFKLDNKMAIQYFGFELDWLMSNVMGFFEFAAPRIIRFSQRPHDQQLKLLIQKDCEEWLSKRQKN